MLKGVLRHKILTGSLALIDPRSSATILTNNIRGSVTIVGDENAESAEVVARLTGRMTPLKLALWPDLYLGEAYMNGSLVLE
ncbi:MAG: hypothetical protein WA863_06205, partial [Methyloceanibacter sp.]